MNKSELHLARGSSLPELLVFIALLIPTFLVLAAAVVSLVRPDPIADPRPAQTTAACEPCGQPAKAEAERDR
jgi:hypothetical protein